MDWLQLLVLFFYLVHALRSTRYDFVLGDIISYSLFIDAYGAIASPIAAPKKHAQPKAMCGSGTVDKFTYLREETGVKHLCQALTFKWI